MGDSHQQGSPGAAAFLAQLAEFEQNLKKLDVTDVRICETALTQHCARIGLVLGCLRWRAPAERAAAEPAASPAAVPTDVGGDDWPTPQVCILPPH
jgi:hypothetical protein